MKSSRIVYLEIPAPDLESAGSFYTSVFGWKVTPSRLSGFEYWTFETEMNHLSGGFDSRLPVSDNGIVLYIKVNDICETLKMIKNAGGSVVKEKEPVGGEHGFSALFKDPNGNVLGLWCSV